MQGTELGRIERDIADLKADIQWATDHPHANYCGMVDAAADRLFYLERQREAMALDMMEARVTA
jgi:hypothetical protein